MNTHATHNISSSNGGILKAQVEGNVSSTNGQVTIERAVSKADKNKPKK